MDEDERNAMGQNPRAQFKLIGLFRILSEGQRDFAAHAESPAR
jgi:hypothetical protein